jgi:molybdopterin-guanine dinucleotide biosynthesis protein A
MSGIHAGLTTAGTQYSFVVPCDMPFLQAGLIKLLVEEAFGFDVAVPQYT